MHCSVAWGLRFEDRRGAAGRDELGGGGGGGLGGRLNRAEGSERERLCLLGHSSIFCARDHGEPLIVQQWSLGDKKGPLCCCH